MTPEKLLDELIDRAIRAGQGKTSNMPRVNEIRAELLRRLGASGVDVGQVAKKVARAAVEAHKNLADWELAAVTELRKHIAQPAAPRMMVDKFGVVHEHCPDCRGECSPYKPEAEQGERRDV